MGEIVFQKWNMQILTCTYYTSIIEYVVIVNCIIFQMIKTWWQIGGNLVF